MELLLNFLWLMLAVPAFLIWRRQPPCLRGRGEPHHPRSFVLLGCLLVLLFPVVSASDDLHTASAEIEESGSFKRTIKQPPGAKSPAWTCNGGMAALLVQVASLRPENEAFRAAVEYLPVALRQVLTSPGDSRAPPRA
jgi:hypothetical protein